MKRTAAAAAPGKGVWKCPDASWAKEYPLITQGMCDPWWDDGKPRGLWSLGIRFDGGQCLLSLIDKDTSSSLYTAGEDVDCALALLEEALRAGAAAWRRWKK